MIFKRKKTQTTFCYCKNCNNELISSGSFAKDDAGVVTYKCTKCGTVSVFDFCLAPAPILIDILEREA